MTIAKHSPRRSLIAAGVLTLILSGCATFSADGGLDNVSAITQERINQPISLEKPSAPSEGVSDTVAQLLAKPLTSESAVQVALLNNNGLRASLAQLGIAEADLVQAGRLGNPEFSFSRLKLHEAVEIERSIMFDLVGLFTMPTRVGIEKQRFQQAQLLAASQAVQLAADTRRAYFNAVAAQETAKYMEQVRTATDAGAELARRLNSVGNISRLDRARQQVLFADATAQLALARHNATVAREQLMQLLGLTGANTRFTLPDRLPDLPKSPAEMPEAEQLAMEQRLDIQMAKSNAEATASALGLTKASRFINVFHLGYANMNETGEPRADGYEIELELPLFDWGGAKTAKAEAIYMQSVHQTADLGVRARSQVREAYSAYRTTYDLAKHYREEVVPLRKLISEEVLLRYNGMLASVFELLADARDQISSVNTAIEAQRDFWIAETALQAAINGTGGNSLQVRGPAPAAAGDAGH
jgi:outer membrane protein TolC